MGIHQIYDTTQPIFQLALLYIILTKSITLT
jgi:hypothetical protein